MCTLIGRRCPRWSCASRIRTTTCPRWTSYFSLFREYHSQSYPRLLIEISQVYEIFQVLVGFSSGKRDTFYTLLLYDLEGIAIPFNGYPQKLRASFCLTKGTVPAPLERTFFSRAASAWGLSMRWLAIPRGPGIEMLSTRARASLRGRHVGVSSSACRRGSVLVPLIKRLRPPTCYGVES